MCARELRTGTDTPPAEYWQLLAEAQVFATLALAPDGVMLPIAFDETRERRARERERSLFNAALLNRRPARKGDDEWPVGEVQG
jgi:hypothetical protein